MRIFSTLALCFFALATLAESSPEDASHRLPVKHVVLYKNGVGYFEHNGRVHGNQRVTIDFTTSQLNDVLKSLTAIDLGNGRVTDVSYNSTAPLNQRLNTLRLSLGEKTTTAEFLDALRGARIEVHSGPISATGRLLSVESKDVIDDGEETVPAKARPVREDRISLMTDAGELRTFKLTPATSVRIVEQDLNQEVGRYLGLVASSRAEDVRRMTISTSGEGERDLRVSYISEVPVWKSTYRIVLPNHSDAKPLLQGWAIVDNTVGEDWDNVELSLIAGAPQSFVQEISQPYYARRPVVGLPELAMLTPQTHEETLEGNNRVATVNIPPGPPPPPSGGPITRSDMYDLKTKSGRNIMGGPVGGGVGSGSAGGLGGGSYHGAGSASETVEVKAEATDVALEKQQITAQTQDIGDLFEYKIRQPVTIHKDQSALVPILQARVDAEKVSLWSPEGSRVLRALWLNNTSGLTLDRGTFNIQEDSTFAGEGLLDPIRPGEKRLISYAADPSVQVESQQKSDGDHVRRVVINRGVMVQTEEQREHRVYTVRNSDKAARTVVIEHPLRSGWKLTSDMKPDETSASHYRFRLNVEPEKTASLVVDEVHSFPSRFVLTDLTTEQITGFLRTGRINSEIETALRPILNQRKELSGYESQINSQRSKLSSIFDDQKRLRENLSALKGNAAERSLIQRYTGELNRQEDELATLRRALSDLESKRQEARNKLDSMLERLTLDTKL
jgi:hypothetical protein